MVEGKEIKIFPYRMSLPFFKSDMATSSKQRIGDQIQRGCVFGLNVKKLIALAFVPVAEIPTAFDLVAA